MKYQRFSFIFTLILGKFSQLFAQTITGFVKDAQTNEVIPFANVFIINTTKGTTTNEKGEFILTNLPKGSLNLSASIVGYLSATRSLKVFNNDTLSVDFMLLPDTKQLNEVSISSKKDKTWEKQFKKFSDALLGESPFAKNCKFSNGYLVDFNENDGKLVANVSQPLEVENLAMGYKLFFTLSAFQLHAQEIRYQGYARFVELKPKDEKELKNWNFNRKMAYQGSDRHFFRSLALHTDKAEGFEFFVDNAGYNPANRSANFYGQIGKNILSIPLNTLVTKGKLENEFRLNPTKRIEIHYASPYINGQFYKDDIRLISWLESTKTIDFNDKGIVQNPNVMELAGFMSNKRLAEMLPLDYLPDLSEEKEIVKNKPQIALDSATKQSLWRLQERVQLYTNKTYYHPKENLWFAGQMLYADATMQDSISKVVYLEWINPQNELILRQKFLVDSLRFQGMIEIPAELPVGNYRLRAYTRWMWNFGENTFFEQIVPVISPKNYLSDTPYSKIISESIVATDKKLYALREKITLNIKNNATEPICISVTDTLTNRRIRSLEAKEKPFLKPDDFKELPNLKYLAETGINFSGVVYDLNDKPTYAKLLFFFSNPKSNFTSETDLDGKFMLSGLSLRDTCEIKIRATDVKGRLLKKILFVSDDFPAISKLPNSPKFAVNTLESAVIIEKDIDLPKDAIHLEGFKVKTKKIIQKDVPPVYGKADYTLQAKDIPASIFAANPILALQGRVPGVQIVEIVDDAGIKQYRVRLRGGQNSITGDYSPLYLIDGIPAEDVNALNSINFDNIDRIEVIKSARAIFGSRGANGVIAFYTKTNSLQKTEEDKTDKWTIKQMTILGFQTQKTFSSPIYTTQKEELVNKFDSRTCIFWQPWTSSSTVSFFAADTPAVYRVLVKSKLGESETFVEVK